MTRFSVSAAARVVLAAAVLGAASPLLLGACEDARFPVCRSNGDCAARDAGASAPVCWNLKCVECHYDADCKGGSLCNASNQCEDLSGGGHKKGRRRVEDASVNWEPGNWDQCAADCKDQDCIQHCEKEFQK